MSTTPAAPRAKAAAITPADVTITVDNPDSTTEQATLTVTTSGKGCEVADFPYPQFVQVIDPVTR
jgi:hypothetical protein